MSATVVRMSSWAVDHLLLFRRGGLCESGQRIVEPVVLTQEVGDRVLILQEQRHGDKVHLHGQGVLDLA
jgi:hypothetical protein